MQEKLVSENNDNFQCSTFNVYFTPFRRHFVFFIYSKRGHQWRVCRLLIPSLLIPLILRWLLKAKRAHLLYQSYWRWSRSEFLSLLHLPMLSCVGGAAFTSSPTQDTGWTAGGKALSTCWWPLQCCYKSHIFGQSSQGKRLFPVRQMKQFCCRHDVFEIKYDSAFWLFGSLFLVEYCVCRFFYGASALFSCLFYFHYFPFLWSVPAADLCVFGPGLCFFRMLAGWWLLFGIYS